VRCPFCGHNDDRVIDSRPAEGGRAIRRRRVCDRCDRRFTTYERVEHQARLVVVKRDGSRVPFDPDTVLRGIQAACGKRPIPEDAKAGIVEAVEEELQQTYEREVDSRAIGELVMARLREVDEVAYIRFASEYHQFMSVTDMQKELDLLKTRPRPVRDQRALFGAEAEGEDGGSGGNGGDGKAAGPATPTRGP
jgi:transcriptional repressor NrdR